MRVLLKILIWPVFGIQMYDAEVKKILYNNYWKKNILSAVNSKITTLRVYEGAWNIYNTYTQMLI